ncbi:probable ATP-dependent RNA helicase DDX46 [Ischnura elegans]|uniref:probable ATP-dependent RNA helicase DDX46 n=1 Tax=Ischnura elegans TaxID=197161 RepID=UPI001ED8A033|nr:probable ATP-dependent RNA helicase DDX46 [Ischnura elegans]
MAEEWNPSVGGGNLLYPELLSREELVQILLSRCVQKQLIEGLDKYKLVDLFHRIVLPLPQRTYSDNRRGKILNALRKKAEMSMKNNEKEANSSSRSGQRSSVSRDDSRLSHEKRSLSKSRDSLDHIVINDRRKRPKSEGESREKSVESPKLASSESKSTTVIKLKRSHTVGEPLPAKDKDNEEDEKKKKRKIVWP